MGPGFDSRLGILGKSQLSDEGTSPEIWNIWQFFVCEFLPEQNGNEYFCFKWTEKGLGDRNREQCSVHIYRNRLSKSGLRSVVRSLESRP
jgi:hypothetical protein